MIFDSIILKLKGIMYLVYCAIYKIHSLLFSIAQNCKLYEVKLISHGLQIRDIWLQIRDIWNSHGLQIRDIGAK